MTIKQGKNLLFAVLLCCALVIAASLYGQNTSTQYPGVHTLQVTIGSGVTQVSSSDLPVKQMFIQNNATHNIRVGDSATTSSRGALISGAASPPGGSLTSGAFGIQQATNLNQWYIAGTQNDVIDVIYIQ